MHNKLSKVVAHTLPEGTDLFTITVCPSCPNLVIDTARIAEILQQVLKEHDFTGRLAARVNTTRPLYHQMFHLAIAGCPNSCSQPQIKDFGLQGQAVPEVMPGCILCGQCVESCLDQAIHLDKDGPSINRERCLNCGQCIRSCPTGTLTAVQRGCRVLVGGKLGRHPRLARVLLPMAGEKETARVLGNCLELFLEQGRPGERFGALLERVETEGLL